MIPSQRLIDLLNRVKKQITDEPLSYFQFLTVIADKKPSKSDPACIVGWLLWFATEDDPKNRKRLGREFDTPLVEELGLMPKNEVGILYLTDKWPQNFREAIKKAIPKQKEDADMSKEKQAKIAIERIDHFIKTGE